MSKIFAALILAAVAVAACDWSGLANDQPGGASTPTLIVYGSVTDNGESTEALIELVGPAGWEFCSLYPDRPDCVVSTHVQIAAPPGFFVSISSTLLGGMNLCYEGGFSVRASLVDLSDPDFHPNVYDPDVPTLSVPITKATGACVARGNVVHRGIRIDFPVLD